MDTQLLNICYLSSKGSTVAGKPLIASYYIGNVCCTYCT